MLKPEAVSPWQPLQSVTARGRLEGSSVVVEMLPCAVQCKSLGMSALWQDEISGRFPMQMDVGCLWGCGTGKTGRRFHFQTGTK